VSPLRCRARQGTSWQAQKHTLRLTQKQEICTSPTKVRAARDGATHELPFACSLPTADPSRRGDAIGHDDLETMSWGQSTTRL